MSGGSQKENSGLNIVTVAAAAASSLGVLGFVIFAGGVVLWSRFKSMGLPADDAVAFVPKSVLIATGAPFLVPALLSAAGVVVLLVAVKAWMDFRPQSGLLKAIDPRSKDADAGASRESETGQAIRPREGRTAAVGRRERRRRKPRLATPGGNTVLRNRAEVSNPEDRVLLPSGWKAACAIGALVFVGEAGFAFHVHDEAHLGRGPLAILVLLAAAGGFLIGLTLCLPIGTAALGLVAFLAVGTFSVAQEFEKTASSLKVVPMAYSRDQPGSATRVETGYLVAETGDRIVFASLPQSPNNELREFPRSETDDLEIGSLVQPRRAKSQAARFAYNLCNRVDALATPLRKTAKRTMPCSAQYVAQLASAAGLILPAHPRASCNVSRRRIRCSVDFSPTVSGTVVLSLARARETFTLGPARVTHGSATLTAPTMLRRGVWKATVTLRTTGHLQQGATLELRLR